MPDTTATRNGTSHIQIDTLITALKTMLGILEEEHQALNTADAQTLENIADQKNLAVDKIGRLYDELKRELGLSSNERGQHAPAQAFMAALDKIRTTTPQLAERLDQLVMLTRACRQSNQDNGTLVSLGLRNCQTNLDLLQNLSQPSQSSTYGAQAQPENSFASLRRLQLRA